MFKAAILACAVALAAVGCASGVDISQICPFTVSTPGGVVLVQCKVDIDASIPVDANDASLAEEREVEAAPSLTDVSADRAETGPDATDASLDVRESGLQDVRQDSDSQTADVRDSAAEARDAIAEDGVVQRDAPLDVSAGLDGGASQLVGVNDIGFWRGVGPTVRAQLQQSMVNMGARAVRIPFANFAADAPQTADTATWRQSVVDAFLAHGITPIPVAFFSRSGREATCGTDPTIISAIVDDWTGDDRGWLQTRNVVLNIANEWGGSDPANGANDPELAVWRDTYVTAIGRIRAAGITAPLLIDAPACGQNAWAVERFGAAVAAADPLGKVIFSVHVYAFWATAGAQSWQFNLAQHFDLLRATGLPIVIGEFSSSEFGATLGGVPAPADVIAAARARAFGWLAWEIYNDSAESVLSGPGNNPQPYPRVCPSPPGVCTSADNLTPFGKVVAAALLGHAP